MQLVTLIDSREKFSGKDRIEGLKEHVKTLTDKGVLAQVRTLVHGDVLWIARSRYAFLLSNCPWLSDSIKMCTKSLLTRHC